MGCQNIVDQIVCCNILTIPAVAVSAAENKDLLLGKLCRSLQKKLKKNYQIEVGKA